MNRVIHGDCTDVLRTLERDSISACVTDPPYHLTNNTGSRSPYPGQYTPIGDPRSPKGGFMGKQWDGGDIAFRPETWRLVFDAMKPGAHLVAFGGTRTYHRMACAIEDAGFEIRDTLCWLYGSGFPKSHDLSKNIDANERKRWLDVGKSLDSFDGKTILVEWIEYLNGAKSAGVRFQKNAIETGTNTLKNGFAPVRVMLPINQKRSSYATAIIAELNSNAVRLIGAENFASVQSGVAGIITESSALAIFVELSPVSLGVTSSQVFTAHSDAHGRPNEGISQIDKAAEALMIWLGSPPSSRQAATTALCVELTDALKRTILNQSETFRNLDTSPQTDCVSAMTAIITESTAASLISFTVDTLRRKGIDKAAGAEREILSHLSSDGVQRSPREIQPGGGDRKDNYIPTQTAPATPDAIRWQGWGTALKPAFEPIILARRPLIGTVVANVLQHGTGAINIDACRVASGPDHAAKCASVVGLSSNRNGACFGDWTGKRTDSYSAAGRWPANVLHDGSEEVEAAFAEFGSRRSAGDYPSDAVGTGDGVTYLPTKAQGQLYADSGTASRFFYSAKADKGDRADSRHPTVKPVDLMRWLVRLVTPPGGTILDPFAGSGTTGEAAMLEGFDCILIERDPQSVADIQHRIKRWSGEDTPLFAEVAAE